MPPRKLPRVSIKSVVLDGVRDGLTYEVIADEIIRQFPESKGAQDPIRYIKYYVAESGQSDRQKEAVQETRKKHGFAPAEPMINPKEIVDQLFLAGVAVTIYRGLFVTYEAATKLGRKDVYSIYFEMTGEHARPDATYYSVHGAVIGHIQNLWYRSLGIPLPPRVEANQAQRLEDVKMAKKAKVEEAAVAEKEPRLTVKSVICAGLLGGKTDEDIAAEVVEMFPGKAAAANPSQHISYYRSALVKAGEIEKQPRKTKAKAEVEEAAPAKPAKGAKAAPAPAKKAAAKKTK